MTVPMAIVDFVPVLFFTAAVVILQRDLYGKMSKGAFAVFCAGMVMICIAGFCKALWKLLYALNICDFERLNLMFFPMQGFGFLLAAIAMSAMVFFRQEERKARLSCIAAPAVFSGTMIFVAMICIGVIGINGVMAALAARMKKKKYIALFIAAAVAMLGMGYLSSKDFADPLMNWSAEATNVLAEGLFLAGVYGLHRAGLGDLKVR